MLQKDPKILIERLELTLKNNNINFEKVIKDFGQVEAAKRRENNSEFTFQEHVKALIFSMLSNRRPWVQIVDKIDKINEIFYYFDPVELENCEPTKLLDQILEIKCGNISIKKQIDSLPHNIQQLKKIEKDFGSLDNFVIHMPTEEIAKLLSDDKSQYKIKQMGFPLAMEYLKSVGISGMKPDRHIIRICGPERLNIIHSNNPKDQLSEFRNFAKAANISTSYLDNLFWIFGAKGYGEICSARPKCEKCELKQYCNYPKNSTLVKTLKIKSNLDTSPLNSSDFYVSNNVMIEPSLFFSPKISQIMNFIENNSREFTFFIPSSFLKLLEIPTKDNRWNEISKFFEFENMGHLRDIVGLIEKNKNLKPFKLTSSNRRKHNFFYNNVSELVNDPLRDIIFEEWVFIQEMSWLVSDKEKIFKIFKKSGGISIEFSKIALDIITRKTLGKKSYEALTVINKLNVIGFYIGSGCLAVSLIINTPSNLCGLFSLIFGMYIYRKNA